MCLEPGGEADASMCLEPGPARCGIRLCIRDFRPLDRAVLEAAGRPDRWERTLWCQGQVCFAPLVPGTYRLTLERGRRSMALVIGLPPGGSTAVCCTLDRGQFCWCPDPACRFSGGWCPEDVFPPPVCPGGGHGGR